MGDQRTAESDFSGLQALTIGHSNLSFDDFVGRLLASGATAVADVRSSPYSRVYPQFEKNALKHALKGAGIAYVFLGRELGGRPRDAHYYTDGIADYEKMAKSPDYVLGLDRLKSGAIKYTVALMCSEAPPHECHRALLVGRSIVERGAKVTHISRHGDELSHETFEENLLAIAGKDHDDMFLPRDERLAEAYRAQSRRFAFSVKRQELESAEKGL